MDNLGQAVTTHYAKAHPDPQLGGTPFDPVTQCTVRSAQCTFGAPQLWCVCTTFMCCHNTMHIVEENRENWAKNWSSSRTSNFGFSLKLKLPNATSRGYLEDLSEELKVGLTAGDDRVQRQASGMCTRERITGTFTEDTFSCLIFLWLLYIHIKITVLFHRASCGCNE